MRFPFTLKTDLRDNYPFGMFAVPRQQLTRLHASSGTTGRPTVVGYTSGDLDRWASLMARSLVCAGAAPGDIVHNAYGYGLFTGGLGAHYGAERLGCTVVPMSGGGTERQVSLISDFGANVLCATPSYALNIAEVAEAAGIDLRRSPLRCGLFGAEPWSEALRRELQERLGIKAVDIYGLSEIMGPGVACECHVMQSGLHGWEDHFLFEIIDPETLEPMRIRRSRRTRHHDAHQGRAADDPLPHARHYTAGRLALRLRPHARSHHARDRPRRRHAHHPRGQRLPVSSRGRARRLSGAFAALPDRSQARRRRSMR